jgi:ethanolamine permease
VTAGEVIQSVAQSDRQFIPLWWMLLLAIFTAFNFDNKFFFRASVFFTVFSTSAIIIYLSLMIPKLEGYPDTLFQAPRSELAATWDARSSLEKWFPDGLAGVVSALPYAFWWFLGVEIIPVCAEEAVQSDRKSPRGMVLGMATLHFIAWGTLLVVPAAPPGIERLSHSSQPYIDTLTLAYRIETSSPLGILVFVMNLSGFCSSLNGFIYAYSRHLYALSRGGYLPAWISVTHPKNHTPIRATILGSFLTYVLCMASYLSTGINLSHFLLNACTMYALISYFCDFITFITLRRKMPYLPRPFKSPLGIPCAVLGALLSLVSIVACAIYEHTFRLAGWLFIAMVGFLVPFYILFVRHWLLLTPEKLFIRAQIEARKKSSIVYGGKSMPKESIAGSALF